MKVHKLNVTIPKDRKVKVQLPEDFPAGPAEFIVLADPAAEGPSEEAQEAMLQAARYLRGFRPTPEEERFLEDLDELRMVSR